MNFNDVASVSIKGNDYRIQFWYMGNDDGISIMNNSSLSEKPESLYFFSLIYKMSETTYYQNIKKRF